MSHVEDTITKLESLRRIAGALHNDIEGLLEDLKVSSAPALIDTPLVHTHAPAVDLPYVQDPVNPTGQVRDAFHSAKPPVDDPKRTLQPVRREAVIHQAGRQPQPLGDAVEELLSAVEANAASQRGPKSPGEVLTQYMSPAILTGGRGFVQPGASGLKRYRETLLNNDDLKPDELVTYPDGFYSADPQGQDEFFIKTPNFMVLVHGLRSTPGLLVFLRSSMGEAVDQGSLSLGERLQLSQELDVVLSSLPE
jgi:hypothetical protein